ncbi:MAG: hypothetical protein IAE66_02310 [Xanthomonadaceae bacterium]|nr:hypothetical protein [Xanthomonadaceae bacterium]
MTRTIEAWKCVGCGRLQAERPCIGVCSDRRIELVEAADYAELAWRVEQLEAALALIAHVTPKHEALPASWLALQARARTLLEGRDAATR